MNHFYGYRTSKAFMIEAHFNLANQIAGRHLIDQCLFCVIFIVLMFLFNFYTLSIKQFKFLCDLFDYRFILSIHNYVTTC